jgi:UDP-glucose 4-epimerase
MANYLVTGGCGFIGSNIVERLVQEGQSVRVLDDLSSGKKENIAPFGDKVELVQGDLRDPDAVARAVDGIDCIMHQAALPSVQRSVENPMLSNDVNVNGTVNLLNAAVKAKVRRVVYAASSSAYGNQPVPVKTESLLPMPLSPYAVAKLTCEYYLKAFHECYGLETVSLRYFNVFGPRQDPNSEYSAVIPLFITRCLRGESPIIYGDGEQSRDFTYVSNNVNANLLAATADGVAGKVFNIACGHSYTLLQLLAEINEILGTDIKPQMAPPRTGDVRHSLADIKAAEKALGYKVEVDFKEGLRRTVEAYR